MPVESKLAISTEACDCKKQSLPLADGPIIFDVDTWLDANLAAMAAGTPPAHAGLGASPDGLNMDATEPDPKKKKFNASEPQLTEFEQRMATALQTRDADKAEENKEEKNKQKGR